MIPMAPFLMPPACRTCLHRAACAACSRSFPKAWMRLKPMRRRRVTRSSLTHSDQLGVIEKGQWSDTDFQSECLGIARVLRWQGLCCQAMNMELSIPYEYSILSITHVDSLEIDDNLGGRSCVSLWFSRRTRGPPLLRVCRVCPLLLKRGRMLPELWWVRSRRIQH